MKHKKIIYIILLLNLLLNLTIGINYSVKNVSATTINSTWNITSDQVFAFETYDISSDILIADDVIVSFLGCTFNFLSDPSNPTNITSGESTNLIFDHCIFNGQYDDQIESGNAFIRAMSDSVMQILSCEIYDLGSNSLPAVESLHSDKLYVENSYFATNRTAVSSQFCKNMTIVNSTFLSNYEYTGANAIHMNYGDYALIENNNITGFNNGIYSMDYLENVTIINNKLYFQRDNSISVSALYPGASYGYGHNISNNMIETKNNGISLGACTHGIVFNNSISTSQTGMNIGNLPFTGGYMKITNNTINFVHLDSHSSNYFKGIEFYGYLFDVILENNAIMIKNETSHMIYLETYTIQEIRNFSTRDSNTLNGKKHIFRYNEKNYTKIYDFYGNNSVNAMTLYNVTGMTFKNLKIENGASIYSRLCKDVVFDNISIINQLGQLKIQECDNTTLTNSSIYVDNGIVETQINVYSSTNITFSNINITRLTEIYQNSYTMNIYQSNNITISNMTMAGNHQRNLKISETNNTNIMNNTFYSKSSFIGVNYNSYNNNITHNKFLREQLSRYRYYDEIIETNQNISLFNNSYDYNLWYDFYSAEDLNDDGYADSAFLIRNDSYDAFPYVIYDNHPLFYDMDDDDLNDAQEAYYGSDPEKIDTDLDLLSDYDEIRLYSSSPSLVDTDGDTISDYEEVNEGTDGYITSANSVDTDGDLFDDNEEISAGSDPTNPNSFPGGNFSENNINDIDEDEGGKKNTVGGVPGLMFIYYFIGITILSLSISYLIRKRKKHHTTKDNNNKNRNKRNLNENSLNENQINNNKIKGGN